MRLNHPEVSEKKIKYHGVRHKHSFMTLNFFNPSTISYKKRIVTTVCRQQIADDTIIICRYEPGKKGKQN